MVVPALEFSGCPQNFLNNLRNYHTHQLFTIDSDVCVCLHPSLSCFSTAASPDDEQIFLL